MLEEKLREFGLSEYESRLYVTLLRKGTMTGGAASKLSGVPHGRSYEVLLKLADKGFVSVLPVKPKIFKAIEPEIAVKFLAEKKIDEITRLEKEIPLELKRVTRISDEITKEKIAILTGKKNALPIIHHFYSTAEMYVKIMFTYELLPLSTIKLQDEALKRGVKIRHLATKKTAEGLRLMKDAIRRGIEVRYYPVQELRLLIKDGNESAQQIVNPKNLMDRTTIVIESKELTKALEGYFDSIWEKAEEIKQ